MGSKRMTPTTSKNYGLTKEQIDDLARRLDEKQQLDALANMTWRTSGIDPQTATGATLEGFYQRQRYNAGAYTYSDPLQSAISIEEEIEEHHQKTEAMQFEATIAGDEVIDRMAANYHKISQNTGDTLMSDEYNFPVFGKIVYYTLLLLIGGGGLFIIFKGPYLLYKYGYVGLWVAVGLVVGWLVLDWIVSFIASFRK